jgi:acyl-[acyl-carrier-protein]-phospholipid O-acyltransferase/long-chain-fatty-acid--[acyl-carrier-protein] ligase
LYPEGQISRTHALGKFLRGYEYIPQNYDGVIVPFFIAGLEGSLFSRCKARKRKSFFQRREITVYFGKNIPKDTKADELQKIIQEMKDNHEQKNNIDNWRGGSEPSCSTQMCAKL